MKSLKYITFIGKAAAVVCMLDLTPLGPKWGVLVFMVASLTKDAVNRVGDYLDDQQLNNSFKP